MKLKNDSLIMVGAAGIALLLVMKAGKAKGATTNIAQFNTGAKEIFDALGKKFSNGYRYFTDGTVIDPSGAYWKNGQMIWAPAATKANMSTATDQALGDWTNEA
jgi:hypothetical protein